MSSRPKPGPHASDTGGDPPGCSPLSQQVRAAIDAATDTPIETLPTSLRPLMHLLPHIAEVLADADASQERATLAESHLDDILDHLRVVEVAMQSLSEARDDASRSLFEARRAAGLPVGSIRPSKLTERIAELREQHASASETCARLRDALERCYQLLRVSGEHDAESAVLRNIRAALES